MLFVDAVNYVKSANKQIWALFSCIVELPSSLRSSYSNIIFHGMWSGPEIDFNLFLSKYNKSLVNLLANGLEIKTIKLTFKIHGLIADSPARAKALNMKQFNGKFGCTLCMHPSERNSSNTASIYPILKEKIEIRTNSQYLKHVTKAVETNQAFKGVKGFSFLSNWLDIPNSIIYDYMHMCLIGSFKAIINNLFSSKNNSTEYYMGMLTK